MPCQSVQYILTAQLGREDPYKGIIPSSEILRLALANCKIVYRNIGMRIVCVEF